MKSRHAMPALSLLQDMGSDRHFDLFITLVAAWEVLHRNGDAQVWRSFANHGVNVGDGAECAATVQIIALVVGALDCFTEVFTATGAG
ncbi:hypothetical protein QOM18_01555 [Serratia marcescens]|nr:hypothetical protein [Serratia marcescens]MDK1706997.1 hypothetical protein [Serratia marcescens]